MAPDRILDMFRTVVNVTGDVVVAAVVASKEGEVLDGAESNFTPTEKE
jgi:Na+/H+-dicarboxylate symporter